MRRTLAIAIVLLLVLPGYGRLGSLSSSALSTTSHVVTGTADSGPGTLRQALLNAQPGDLILFEPSVFAPGAPVSITLTSPLPPLGQGDLTANASNAGVVLDGTGIADPMANGLDIVSDGNTVQGLQIVGFPNNGIELRDDAQNNTIGGDRNVGSGPLGQGNLASNNGNVGIFVGTASFNTIVGNYVGTDPGGILAWGNTYQGILIVGGHNNQIIHNLVGDNDAGIGLHGPEVHHNVISGNAIGVDFSGENSLGNRAHGIPVTGGASDNVIGPDNAIAYNLASGIEVYGSKVHGNIITGNDIHDNGLGNHAHGIRITGGASNNMIGPDNVIAYNEASGIELYGSDCQGNTITQNSIYDNGWLGIDLWGGSNENLDPPVLLYFDRDAGTVSGLAYSNSIVEIFSADDEEGRVYEGQAATDGAGLFVFDKGSPFAGPHLTATVTDGTGNSSEFSIPTIGDQGALILQEANNLPTRRLFARQSRDLVDNRIASHWHGLWTYQPLSDLLDEARYMGVKRFRLAINDGDWDKVDWSKSEFSVDPSHDQFVTDLAENGIEMTYFLSFWDKAAYPGGVGYPCPRFLTEAEIQRYLDFVRFIVGHFQDRVRTYEIWNEPDVSECAQHIEVEDYINLVRRAVPVIRQEYPEARIQVGGTTGLSNPDSQAYLFAILESDVMSLVDVVSWHPFYGESPESHPEYYANYPALVQNIMDVASAHGFTGEYEADEMNWRSSTDSSHTEPWSYPETVCAKYYARQDVRHLGMNVTAGNLRISHDYAASTATVRNLATLMAGAEPISLPLTVQTAVTDVVSYTFALPGDAYLVALWSDGIAAEADQGVTATLHLAGQYDGYKIVAVDPLYGLQQEVLYTVEAGGLVIPHLMVKDYPLILRPYVPRYVFLPTVLKGVAP